MHPSELNLYLWKLVLNDSGPSSPKYSWKSCLLGRILKKMYIKTNFLTAESHINNPLALEVLLDGGGDDD